MNCEPHPKSSSPHRPRVGEVWEAHGPWADPVQFTVAHCTPWTVEGPRYGIPKAQAHRVVTGRSALTRRIK